MTGFLDIGGQSAGGGYQIPRSLRFRSSAQLARTFTGGTANQLITKSFWVKRGKLGAAQTLYTVDSGVAWFSTFLEFTAGDQLRFWTYYGAVGTRYGWTTTRVFRDPSAWMHIQISVDTSQSGQASRRLWVNGVEETAFTAEASGYNTAGMNHYLGYAGNHAIGASSSGHEGYLAEYHSVVGSAFTSAASFGETSATTGQWQAKKYTGTYGTNGFYLPFSDTTSTTTLCADASGNGNNWTPTNISLTAGATYDSMTDVPLGGGGSLGNGQGNYATLNPLVVASGGTRTDGNLTITTTATNNVSPASIQSPTLLQYAEVYLSTKGAPAFGVYDPVVSAAQNPGAPPASFWHLYDNGSGLIRCNNGATVSVAAAATNTDTWQVAYDPVNGRCWVGRNNAWYDSSLGTTGNPSAGTNPTFSGLSSTLVIFFGNGNAASTMNANFGQRPFAYTPPTGFKALHTGNLPAPAITKAKNHFDVITDTGANIKAAVEALYSDQALMVVKDRANVNNWQWFNDVIGLSAILQSNTTSAETTYSAPSGSSVGYGWKAGGAGVTNNAGSITSTVSDNPAAGFSIVTYTGTGANATVGHGLGVAPAMMIIKNRQPGGAYNWVVWHNKYTGGSLSQQFIPLNTTAAVSSDTGLFNSTLPTSAVFSVGAAANTNENTKGHVAYCFSEIAGYSKFGSYTGNGSADGPFVYCGFRPRWVVIKRTDAVGNWNDFDTSRNTANPANNLLLLNTADAEVAGGPVVDFTSNGFKLRDNSANWNTSGGTYIFMAFAESPFQSALAR